MAAGSPVLMSASGSFIPADQGKYIQVIGAGPGGSSRGDAVMVPNSAVLTSSAGTFAASDIGRGIVVVGAGPGGSNLVGTIRAYASPTSVILSTVAQSGVSQALYYYGAMTLEGAIQSVQNSSTVILSIPAVATISGALFAYGTDNHVAFQAAVDSAGAAGGGQVSVPAPSTCPSGAVCGYVIKASDQMTAQAPGGVKIRYNNVSLIGDSPQTNLFCRGAYGTYINSVAYPGVTGNIRGFCLSIGDNGGANGVGGESISNVTIARLHLYGMTNGNTFNVNFAYPPQTSDGWDITHKGIYMWDQGVFSNITIDSMMIQDFKAENIYSGGSPITNMAIKNSTLMNFNGNGISMLAADLQVLNNTITNGSNSGIENNTSGSGPTALIRQIYQGNTISRMQRHAIVVAGVDYSLNSGYVQIAGNTFETIAQINRAGIDSAILISAQRDYTPTANVTVSGNTCHDCYEFGVFNASGDTLVQGNNFVVDRYGAGSVFDFTYAMTGVTITGNTGSVTSYAQANNLSPGAVYYLNPGYNSGGFPWKNVVIGGNSWTFPGVPQYQFVTTSGLGWNLVTLANLNWQGDVCSGCTYPDADHGVVDLSGTDLSGTTSIKPYGPVVYVTGNLSPVTATVDASKEEDGAQVQIVNGGPNAVSFVSDTNLSLPYTYTLPGGKSSAVSLIYSAAAGKFILLNPRTTIDVSAGSPQSTTVNTPFRSPLRAIVKDGNGNPASGAAVTFTAPGSGPGATFGGLSTAAAVTDSNGIATAPVLTANGQAGSYSVTAGISGAVSSAVVNKAKHTASETFAVTNSSAQTIAGPLQLVIASVPAGYTPVGNAGNLKGNPYWTVPNSTLLAPGATAKVTITFACPAGANPRR